MLAIWRFSYSTAVLLLALQVTACAKYKVWVGVDSLAAPEASIKKRFVLFPGNKGVSPDDLQFREFAAYIERALTARGFSLVPIQEADIAIFVSYGVGNPEHHEYTKNIPIYGQTGISSATTSGTVSTFGNMGSRYSATTTYTPTYGITGYQAQTHRYTTYTRFLFLQAYDLARYRTEGQQVQVWTTAGISTGSSDDLRDIFPYLAASLQPYIAENTGKRTQVVVDDLDQRVIEIRGEQKVSP